MADFQFVSDHARKQSAQQSAGRQCALGIAVKSVAGGLVKTQMTCHYDGQAHNHQRGENQIHRSEQQP